MPFIVKNSQEYITINSISISLFKFRSAGVPFSLSIAQSQLQIFPIHKSFHNPRKIKVYLSIKLKNLYKNKFISF